MKHLFLMITVLFASISAKADLIQKAVLDVTCTSTETKQVIEIISTQEGTTVSVDGVLVHIDEQLSGGTEGGDPYLQAVGGGYNITISGGDFQTAFYGNSTIENGTAEAYVNFYGSTDSDNATASYKATCTGKYSFAE